MNSHEELLKVAYKLNTFFVGFGEKYTKTLKNVSIRFNNKKCNSSFDKLLVKKIMKTNLLKIINIKDDISSGFDKISVKILKKIPKYSFDPLIYIFSFCLKTRNFT